MKNISTLFKLFALVLFFGACSEEDTNPRIVASDAKTDQTSLNLLEPQSGGSYILTVDKAADVWATFMWEDANAFKIPTQSYIEVDTLDGDFSLAVKLGPYNESPVDVTQGMMNEALVSLGFIKPESLAEVKIRVMQEVNADYIYYSDTVSYQIIGYGGSPCAEIPQMYVPGSHQNWDPSNTYALFASNCDGIFSGYVNYLSATDNFKINTEPSWAGINYGKGASEGTLDPSGGDIVSGLSGSVLLTVDMNDLTYTIVASPWTAIDDSWGIIGSATTGGWDTDTNMTYNQANGLLELVTPLTVGAMKFRSNGSWDKNYGDIEGDGIADEGGGDIPIAEAGNYKIQLDMRNPNQVKYTLVKQ